MGTTLTGTTPQDTYDSLIKVTDNGPLSGTAKYLSDGLGNDSVLALSTTAVGIGTTSPDTNLQVAGTGATGFSIRANTSGDAFMRYYLGNVVASDAYVDRATGTLNIRSNQDNAAIAFSTSAALVERMRITATGNVGIGTSAPVGFAADDIVLQVNCPTASPAAARSILRLTNSYTGTTWGNGSALVVDNNSNLAIVNYEPSSYINFLTNDGSTIAERVRIDSNGIKFNGDTAAANALDDYEEGTWTMGVAFGGASVGVTTTNNTGTYTKIGRQVTVNGVLSLSSKGSSSGTATITGLPFTITNSNPNFASASLWLINISFANQFQAYGNKNTTTIVLTEITEAGVVTDLSNADFANNSEVMVNFTYFV